MFYLILFLFLYICYRLGDDKKRKYTMREVERDIFISDVISGKKKL